jgi:hypothetical protein
VTTASESCPVAQKRYSAAVLGHSGRVCVVRPPQKSGVKQRGGGPRGEIRNWSPGSRRRLLFGLGCLDFERERGRGGRWLSVTVTYGHDPGSERFRRDRKALLMMLRKHWGNPKHVWKVEFHQHWRGGVPHLHLMVLMQNASESKLRAFRRWLWPTWERISGGSYRVDARFTTARILATYVASDYTMQGRKEVQHRVPEGWGNVGRWWAINGLKANWVTRPLTVREFARARALVRLQVASDSGRCGTSYGFGSAWTLSDSGEAFSEAVMGFLEDCRSN